MNYEMIFVDWDGTLSNSRFWERWRDDPEHAEKYAKIQKSLFETAAGKNLVQQWMTGQRNYTHAIKHVHEWQHLPVDELEAELQYSAENMKLIDPSVLTTVQKLRDTGKFVVIATDNMDTFDKWTVPALGLQNHFDNVLNSNKIQKLKSHIHELYNRSEFFYRYLNDMGIAPENAVLLDNDLDAKRLESIGINFLHVTDEQPLSYHLDNILKNC
jgi:FMN phosphatase YigB (HAD superfamily)